jgi:hypothetical protein
MALIPGYEFDIFISYSHANNKVFPDQKDGWIKKFFEYLKTQLDQVSDGVSIWWDDKRLEGNTNFDNSIAEGIKKSAILICLNSLRYKDSDYCKKELDLFYEKVKSEKAGLTVANNSRIFNVLINNIPHKEWLNELQGTSGFHFHDAEQNSKEFGDPLELGTPEFRKAMKQLRDAIYILVNDFPKEKTQAQAFVKAETKAVDNKNAFTIFLGEVTDNLRTPRKRISSELKNQGYNVIIGSTPDDAAEHEKATTEALKNSNLAIHLMDKIPGREIDGDPNICYPQKQAEFALKLGIPQMIWVPTDIDFTAIDDENYKSFLKELETGSKVTEFVRGSTSTLSQQIIDLAEELKTKQSQKKPELGKVSVFLDTHCADQEYASDLYNGLLQNKIKTFINPQADEPSKINEKLKEKISQSNKLIFLYGSVSKDWLVERINIASKLIATNDYNIESFIYMAPPFKDIASLKRAYGIKIIDSSKNQVIDEAQLKQILDTLNTSTA